jgi:hypothetical protein
MSQPLNGAQTLASTRVNRGVNTCISNPGTPEMRVLDVTAPMRPELRLDRR